jgi:uncharacterized protein YqhQ
LAGEKPNIYGGQAVIEGVMFAGKTVHVTAVRHKHEGIKFYEVPRKQRKWVQFIGKIPFVRGLLAIILASASGAKHLNFSAEIYADGEIDDGEKRSEPQQPEKKSWSETLTLIFGVSVVGVLSFLFGKFVFTLVPAIVEDFLFGDLFHNQIGHNLIEGGIKILLLVGYILLIAQTPLIKRLFQYHGAEHKVISAYEAGKELTVDNVQKFSTLHYRCGSSFMVLTVLIGVFIYSLVQYDDLWDRVLQRLYLLPVVIGLSFEVLRWTNQLRDTPILRYLGYPGLWLQLLTTKQPTDDQVEVAIASFNRMLEADARADKQS